MNWIKIEEKLPPENKRVLVVVQSEHYKPKIAMDWMYTPFYGGDARWACFVTGEKVTHWMPLPDFPEGVVNG